MHHFAFWFSLIIEHILPNVDVVLHGMNGLLSSDDVVIVF